MVAVDKKERSRKMIDFAVRGGSRVEEKVKNKRKISSFGKGVAEDTEC